MFEQLTDRIESIFRQVRGLGKITDSNIKETVREIRRVLLEADVNLHVVREFLTQVQNRAEGTKVLKSIKPGEQFIKIIHEELVSLLGEQESCLNINGNPTVILLAGLQGSGKTTTAAKLAKWIHGQNQSVLLVAADVYRPAAIEQLKTLGRLAGIEVYDEGIGDPVSICKNALIKARKDKTNVVILDTAGRLHINDEMMKEIQNIFQATNAGEILYVADSMTGQDAVHSAKSFADLLPLTGIILTKLDGDAKGGAAVSIRKVTGKPIKFAGISERLDGLEPFNPRQMADRILGFGDVLSLVQKAERIVNDTTIKNLEKKLKENAFDLEDFLQQISQLKKMGSLQNWLGIIPGMNRKMFKGVQIDDRQILWTEAMINSMTRLERKNPEIIDGSRRKRIAGGSGRSLQEVNQLLKQFFHMKKMINQLSKMKPGRMPHFAGIS